MADMLMQIEQELRENGKEMLRLVSEIPEDSVLLRDEISEMNRIIQLPISDSTISETTNQTSKVDLSEKTDELKEDKQLEKDSNSIEARALLAKKDLDSEIRILENLVIVIDSAIQTFMDGTHPKEIKMIEVSNVLHDVLVHLDEAIQHDNKNKSLYREMRRSFRKIMDLKKILISKQTRIETEINNSRVSNLDELKGELKIILTNLEQLKRVEEFILDIEKSISILKDAVRGNISQEVGSTFLANYHVSSLSYKNEKGIKDKIISLEKELRNDSVKLQQLANPKKLPVLFHVLHDLKLIQAVKKQLIDKILQYLSISIELERNISISNNKILKTDITIKRNKDISSNK